MELESTVSVTLQHKSILSKDKSIGSEYLASPPVELSSPTGYETPGYATSTIQYFDEKEDQGCERSEQDMSMKTFLPPSPTADKVNQNVFKDYKH